MPKRLPRQASMVAEAAGLDRTRLLKWILSYAGLSAAWTLGDGCKPDLAMSIAELAARELAMIKVRRRKDTSVASGSRP